MLHINATILLFDLSYFFFKKSTMSKLKFGPIDKRAFVHMLNHKRLSEYCKTYHLFYMFGLYDQQTCERIETYWDLPYHYFKAPETDLWSVYFSKTSNSQWLERTALYDNLGAMNACFVTRFKFSSYANTDLASSSDEKMKRSP